MRVRTQSRAREGHRSIAAPTFVRPSIQALLRTSERPQPFGRPQNHNILAANKKTPLVERGSRVGSRTSPAGEIGLSMLTVTQLRLAKSASASALACGAGLFTRRAERSHERSPRTSTLKLQLRAKVLLKVGQVELKRPRVYPGYFYVFLCRNHHSDVADCHAASQ